MYRLHYLSFLWLLLIIAGGNAQSISRQKVNQILQRLNTGAEDTSRLNCLVELGKFHIYKQGEAKSDLDSAFSYLMQAKELNKKLQDQNWENEIESTMVIGYMERTDSVQGRALFNQLIQNFRRHGYKEAEAALRLKMGVWLAVHPRNYPEVLENYTIAAALCHETKNVEKEIRLQKEIALIHYYQGQLSLAQVELEAVIERYKSIGYKKLHYAYSILSNICRLKGDFTRGLDYAFKCLQSMEATKDTLLSAAFYGDVGRMYLEVGNEEKGMEWYEKVLNLLRNQGLPNYLMYDAAGYLAQHLVRQHKVMDAMRLVTNLSSQIPPLTRVQKGCVAQNLAYCYDALQNYTEAERLYLQAVDWYEQAGNGFETPQRILFDVGKFYVARGQLSKAGNYLRKSLTFLPQKIELATIKDTYLLLFTVDSAEGNYLSAIRHLREHKRLNDSIFSATKSWQIGELEVKYETEKKEQDIRQLNSLTQVQQTKLRDANKVKRLTFSGLALLLVILVLLYSQYAIKKRNHREMAKKNAALQRLVKEKEWLVKEIHHRVKNNLQIVISLFNAQLEFLDSPSAVQAIKEGRERMQAIALIHQKLYRPDQASLVNMASYVPELVTNLKSSFSNTDRIQFTLDVDEISLDVSQAVPLGLILNEAVTNAVKYAFPDNNGGKIQISLKKVADHELLLQVRDNGVGFSEQFETGEYESLGIQLIKLFAEQLEADLQIANNFGVEVLLRFKPQEGEEHTALPALIKESQWKKS